MSTSQRLRLNDPKPRSPRSISPIVTCTKSVKRPVTKLTSNSNILCLHHIHFFYHNLSYIICHINIEYYFTDHMKSTFTIPKHVFNCMSFLFSFLILHIMYSVYKLLLTLSIFFCSYINTFITTCSLQNTVG